jgi:hypothetical protein
MERCYGECFGFGVTRQPATVEMKRAMFSTVRFTSIE